MDVIGPIALLMAIVCGMAAGYMLWMGQNANRTGRGALFHTERQVAIDRARRARMTALGLGGVAVVLLLINVVASTGGGLVSQPTVTPTRTPPPPTTMAPAARETLVATLSPTATPTPPLPKAVVTNADDPGLRLRQTPSTSGEQIDYLKDGTVLDLLPEAQVKTDDGITWQKVRDPLGREGWVATAYIVNQ